MTGVHHHIQFYAVLGIEVLALFMQGKHSTNWAKAPASTSMLKPVSEKQDKVSENILIGRSRKGL